VADHGKIKNEKNADKEETDTSRAGKLPVSSYKKSPQKPGGWFAGTFVVTPRA